MYMGAQGPGQGADTSKWSRRPLAAAYCGPREAIPAALPEQGVGALNRAEFTFTLTEVPRVMAEPSLRPPPGSRL